MIDLSFQNRREPKVGNILLSDPFLDEDFFRRSVILLCEHNENGTFGFVLNNYIQLDLHDLDPSFPDIHARISVGGPVETESLYYIHNFEQEVSESVTIEGQLKFGGDFEEVQEILRADPSSKDRIRFFLGYSGWRPDQLEEELKENSWIVVENITAEEIMDTSNSKFWNFCLEKQGERFKTISKFPLNPNNN